MQTVPTKTKTVREISLEEIEKSIRLYAPNADLSLLTKAYAFSIEAHKGQVRASGNLTIITLLKWHSS